MTWASNGAARFRLHGVQDAPDHTAGSSRRHQGPVPFDGLDQRVRRHAGDEAELALHHQPELEFLRDRHRDECDEDIGASITGGDRVEVSYTIDERRQHTAQHRVPDLGGHQPAGADRGPGDDRFDRERSDRITQLTGPPQDNLPTPRSARRP